jgi:GTPase SAR1 family protein
VTCGLFLGYDVTRCFLLLCSDYLFKLLLIGDSGVGKSCLLLRFAVSIFFNVSAIVFKASVRRRLGDA